MSVFSKAEVCVSDLWAAWCSGLSSGPHQSVSAHQSVSDTHVDARASAALRTAVPHPLYADFDSQEVFVPWLYFY